MRKILIVIILISCKAEAQSSALAVADSLYALGNYSKAISVYQKTPKNSLKIAKSYEALGNLTKAVDFYKAALQENSKSTIIQYNYAKLLMRARKFESADTLIRELIQQQPSNPNFVYQYGLLLEKVNDTIFQGYRYSKGWAKNQKEYFSIVLSKPADSFYIIENDKKFKTNVKKGNGVN